LSRDPQEKLFANQTPYCFAANNPIRFIDINGEGPGLDFKSLQGNPIFQGMTVKDLRDMVRSANPGLEEYKVQISAGHMLENAYADFSGFRKNSKTMLSSVSFYGIRGIMPRKIKPDFVQPTMYKEGKKEKMFLFGGYYEVTATSQTVTLKMKDKQIEAYFNKLPYASTMGLDTEAGDVKSAQLTLVLPYGTTISDEVKEMATRNGVNLYVSYAFRNMQNGAIVFSNPEKVNEQMKSEMPYPDIGNINKPAIPDATKAGSIWKKPETASNKTNETEGQD